jgi:RNA polymerase sigma-70 factor (ECF subfamily)
MDVDTGARIERLLVEFLTRGDASAMEEFVRRTRPRLLAAARRIGSPQDAADSVQAAYHSLLARGTHWEGAPPMAWLLTAVVRIAYRRKALARRHDEIARRLDRPRELPTPVARLAADETARIVRDAATALPAKYRDVVVLHHLEGLSTTEVAQLLGVPRSTVTTRLHRGRALLRRALPPRLMYVLFFLPWLLRDAAAAASGTAAGIGGIMKVKTIATVVVVGLAAGATGWGAAHVAGAAAPSSTRATPGVPELEVALAGAQREVEELRRELDARPRPDAGRDATPPATAAEPEPVDSAVSRARVRDEALRLSAPAEALLAAIRAEEAIAQNRDDQYDLIREVQRFGEGGFRAALAIVRGGPGAGEPQLKLLDETYLPGLEGLLLDTLESKDVRDDAKAAAIHTLAKADTPAVRDHLVARIGTERDRGLFWTLVVTLGELREPRAAKHVAAKLLFDDRIQDADWKPMRLGMLWHLSQMGGEDAVRALRDFASDARVTDGDQIVQALTSLCVLDRPLCGEVAGRILEEPRGRALPPEHAERVRNFATFAPR